MADEVKPYTREELERWSEHPFVSLKEQVRLTLTEYRRLLATARAGLADSAFAAEVRRIMALSHADVLRAWESSRGVSGDGIAVQVMRVYLINSALLDASRGVHTPSPTAFADDLERHYARHRPAPGRHRPAPGRHRPAPGGVHTPAPTLGCPRHADGEHRCGRAGHPEHEGQPDNLICRCWCGTIL